MVHSISYQTAYGCYDLLMRKPTEYIVLSEKPNPPSVVGRTLHTQTVPSASRDPSKCQFGRCEYWNVEWIDTESPCYVVMECR